MSSSIQQKYKNVSFGDQGFSSQNGSGIVTNQGYSQVKQGQYPPQHINQMNNLQLNNFQQNQQYTQQYYQQQQQQQLQLNYQNQLQQMQQQQMNNLQQNSHSVSNQSQLDDQNQDDDIVQRRQFDDEGEGAQEQQNSEQISHQQVQEEDNEDEEDEEDQEIYQCVKCGNYAEQALMMECKHILCLNCASFQYKMILKTSQGDQSQDLIQSIDCENCGIQTPLPEQTIKVLLTLDSEQPQTQYSNHKSQDHLTQKGNIMEQQANYYQYQQNHQQFQQQQQNLQQFNPYPQINPSSVSYNQQQQQLKSGIQQQQQTQTLPNKQNINNQNIPRTSEVRNALQDNQFHENIKQSKQKKMSGDTGSMKQSILEKSNDQPILYCFTCESSCFSLEDYLKGLHKNHNVKNVSKSYEELQEPIDDLRFKIKTRADLLIQDELRLNKKKDELNNALEACKAQIKQSFEDVLQVLLQKQQELIQQAEECIEEKFGELDNGISKVNSNLNTLNTFDKNIVDTYYQQERTIQNEIRAFDYYSENKTKILETIEQMDLNLFHTLRDKSQYKFSLDKNSLYSHINSIKTLKVEIFRLKGLDNPDPNRIETKFYSNETQEKSKKLLEQIMQQHANSTGQESVGQNISNNTQSVQNPIQQQLINSQSLIHQSNLIASPSKLLSNKIDSSVADIFNSHKIQIQQISNQNTSKQVSPGRYKIQMNSTSDATTRYNSPLNNISNTSRKIKLSPSGRDLNSVKSSQLSQTSIRGPSPIFKKFSISSQSTKQVFSNILQSPPSIAKKYTPQYERVSLQPKDSVFMKQNKGISNATNNKTNNSKNNIFEKLDNFKKNMEVIRKQGQNDENNLNQQNNDFTQSTAEEKASIAVENRIRQLEEKLQTKFC